MQHSGFSRFSVTRLVNDHAVMGSTLLKDPGQVVCAHCASATKQQNLVPA